MQAIIHAVPTHIITGFLGAGKTTFLNSLLAQKPAGETWAVLINELGQIGIDQALISEQQGIAVKEVIGGCLCCTSQLPMQIALSRLLSSIKPDRLFIEPTGLGHPAQLIEQLSEPHWAKALSLRAVIALVNGRVFNDARYMQHETFLAQIDAADMIFISNKSAMSAQDNQSMVDFQQKWTAHKQRIECIEQDGQPSIALQEIDVPRVMVPQKIRSLLHLPHVSAQSVKLSENVPEDSEAPVPSLPYHYVMQASGQEVGGWRLPAGWVFERDAVLNVLYDQKNWLRIKGVIRTQDEWININLTPYQIGITSRDAFSDSRLEVIGDQRDWALLEQQLMACVISQTIA
jgi:G3E family GTPase